MGPPKCCLASKELPVEVKCEDELPATSHCSDQSVGWLTIASFALTHKTQLERLIFVQK